MYPWASLFINITIMFTPYELINFLETNIEQIRNVVNDHETPCDKRIETISGYLDDAEGMIDDYTDQNSRTMYGTNHILEQLKEQALSVCMGYATIDKLGKKLDNRDEHIRSIYTKSVKVGIKAGNVLSCLKEQEEQEIISRIN